MVIEIQDIFHSYKETEKVIFKLCISVSYTESDENNTIKQYLKDLLMLRIFTSTKVFCKIKLGL